MLEQAGIRSPAQVYERGDRLVCLSGPYGDELGQLEAFLLENFYRHPNLLEQGENAQRWLRQLFEALCRDKTKMPGYYQQLSENQGLERTVTDYIAGMTDAYCRKMLEKI
jgi:dGTPase